MRKLTLLFLFLISFSFLSAKHVPVEIAKEIAKNCLVERFGMNKTTISITANIIVSNSGNDLYYIFNTSPKGFVMVAADDRVIPVLGYSNESNFDYLNISPAFSELLDNYKMQVDYAIKNNLPATEKIKKEWKHFTNNTSPKGNLKNVIPLVTTKWGQGKYYNALCPVDSAGPDNHALVGCVAVAMGQVMRYHQHPTQPNGSHSYNHPTYGILSANFGNATYNYSNMPNYTSTYNNDIATLLYHCGVSVNMNYGPSASGSQSAYALSALKNYFGYSSSTIMETKSGYADSTWAKLLRIELDEGRPMYYAGAHPTNYSAHAFVCDGYQGDNHFHFNWGWNGYADGYFVCSNLNPAGSNFNADQHVILIRENVITQFCGGFKTMVAPSDTLSDGGGKYFYKNSSFCNWRISPTGAQKIYLHFTEFALEDNFDFLYVYDGSSPTSTLIGKYSGHTIPPPIVSSTGSLFIRFTSDGAVSDEGWTAVYSVTNTSVEDVIETKLDIYPNPSSGLFTIDLVNDWKGKVEVSIRSIMGKEVSTTTFEKQSKEFSKELNLSGISQGVYMIRITSGEEVYLKKVILQ